MGRDGANTHGGTKLIQTDGDEIGGGIGSATRELLSCLLPDDTHGNVRQVRINDSGSKQRHARVLIEGVPVEGTIDSGSDITTIGRDLFRRVASVARLRKSHLLKPDKAPKRYDGRTFCLDGKMNLDIWFNGKTMKTPLYIKLDAPEQLPLAEGACRQLHIISYHPDVTCRTSAMKKYMEEKKVQPRKCKKTRQKKCLVEQVAQVGLIHSVRVLPCQCTYAQVEIEKITSGAILVESDSILNNSLGIMVGSSLLKPDEDGVAKLPIWNPAGFTRTLEAGEILGKATEAAVVHPSNSEPEVQMVSAREETGEIYREQILRKEKLRDLLGEPDLPPLEKEALLAFLADHHHALSLQEGERGETDLIQMEIDTGDAYPKRQPARRLLFTLRQEVARQLREMQTKGVIQPSKSPWASPVVLVKKKDGTHRFCVDYRQLNSITKTDNFPLSRIYDLLDQLGKSKYFSSIDLASGFWQIKMHPSSQEKIAFVTLQGLYEFRVMPFGLKNASGVFQRLMQKVVSAVNPSSGPDFVSVYLDDILFFSRHLDDHLEHLRLVIERLVEVGLKLKPSKCKFAQHSLEYLGHIVSREGLRTTPKLTEAVAEFSRPQSVSDVRRFLGLALYYRRFFSNFAKVCVVRRVSNNSISGPEGKVVNRTSPCVPQL